MASFKTRRTLISKGGTKTGSDGNIVRQIMAGTTTGCMNVATTVTQSTGSFVVAGLPADALIIGFIPGSLPADVFLPSASVTAASVITASFYNSGSATAAESAITMQYWAISAS